MAPEIPPPYVQARPASRGARFILVEPVLGKDGRMAHVEHPLGSRSDPRVALEHLRTLLREREAWATGQASPDELRQIATSKARVESLEIAVAKFEAASKRPPQ